MRSRRESGRVRAHQKRVRSLIKAPAEPDVPRRLEDGGRNGDDGEQREPEDGRRQRHAGRPDEDEGDGGEEGQEGARSGHPEEEPIVVRLVARESLRSYPVEERVMENLHGPDEAHHKQHRCGVEEQYQHEFPVLRPFFRMHVLHHPACTVPKER